jgi:hypothetical protein
MAPKKPPLTLVRSTATVSPPPRKLGKTGRVLWDTVMTEYQIHDIGGVELLMQACLAADRADALAEIINRDGETIHTKSGLRAHPCLKDELQNRAFVVRTLERLGLNIESIKPSVGRPPSGFGWRGDT